MAFKARLTFDYEWMNGELLLTDNFTTGFQGKIIREATRTGNITVADLWRDILSLYFDYGVNFTTLLLFMLRFFYESRSIY